MRSAEVFVNNMRSGVLTENSRFDYIFKYDDHYQGSPVSLTLPLNQKEYQFKYFPSFFEGLLPEGYQLEALLRDRKINRSDLFEQLMVCGADCVGAVTVKEIK